MNTFEITCQKHRKFDDVVKAIRNLSETIRNNAITLFTLTQTTKAITQRRSDTQFMEYQLPERKVRRPIDNDRVFPLDTISKEEFSKRTDTKLENVTIHTGYYADEYARSFNALALTLANDIFFRNGAYNPTSEEGRKTIAHELTHVGQYTEKRITKNVTEKELEEEAERVEKYEVYNPDPYVTIDLNGKYFRMRRSEMPKFADGIVENIEKWIREQRVYLDGQEYLKQILGLTDWIMEAV